MADLLYEEVMSVRLYGQKNIEIFDISLQENTK